MSCERFRKTLTDLAAGSPVPAETEDHLASCSACRAELLALRETLSLADSTLREIVAEEPGPELRTRIRRVIEEEQVRGTWLAAPPWRWAAASLGLLLAAVALWLVGDVLRETRPSPAHAPRTGGAVTDAPLPERARHPESSRKAANRREPSVATSTVAANRSRRPQNVARPEAMEPQVIVQEGAREALLQFADQVKERTVAPDSLLVGDPWRELPDAEPIRIDPLEIAPLDGAGQS